MKNKFWTDDRVEFLKNNHEHQTSAFIAKSLGVTVNAVHNKASKLGLRKTIKHVVNHDYFKTWSHDMAYTLGFIMADGCVSTNNGYRLQISLNIKDREIIDFIRSQISPDASVFERHQQCKTCISHQITLSVFSKELVVDLISLNVVPNKTGKEKLPEIPEEFKGSYLRGLFDGDGCFSNKTLTIASQTLAFCEEIKQELCLGLGHVNKSSGCYVYTTAKHDVIKQISNLMYESNHFSLVRKRVLLKN